MATTLYKKGSTGDAVKQIQTALNNNGYKLDVDGIYGSQTAAAVTDYQKKNNLGVDGIVGSQTWGSLFPTANKTTTSAETTTPAETESETAVSAKVTLPEAPEAPTVSAPAAYVPSEAVKQAEAALQAQLANKPGAYTSSFQTEIDDVLNRILNREEFSYDVNGDALWQQIKDQYMASGQKAMMDTMGQAAALTGGYGNSWAQSAGQQAYQGQMQQATDMIPELYQLALDRYNAEGDDLMQEYSLYADREAQDYARYADTLDTYYTDLANARDAYNQALSFDYDKYLNDADAARWAQEFNYNAGLDAYNAAVDRAMFEYEQSRDAAADTQWAAEFNEAVRQYNLSNGIADDSTGGSSGSSGSSSSTGNDKNQNSNTDPDLIDNKYVKSGSYYSAALARAGSGEITTADVDKYLASGMLTKEQAEAVKALIKENSGTKTWKIGRT